MTVVHDKYVQEEIYADVLPLVHIETEGKLGPDRLVPCTDLTSPLEWSRWEAQFCEGTCYDGYTFAKLCYGDVRGTVLATHTDAS